MAERFGFECVVQGQARCQILNLTSKRQSTWNVMNGCVQVMSFRRWMILCCQWPVLSFSVLPSFQALKNSKSFVRRDTKLKRWFLGLWEVACGPGQFRGLQLEEREKEIDNLEASSSWSQLEL
jgi:hypothetical protein